MQGPSQASQPSMAAWGAAWRMWCTSCSSTPLPPCPANPRQPAWAAPAIRCVLCVSNTGKQSATMMVQATPAAVLKQASACNGGAQAGASAPSRATPTPCTCCKKTGCAPPVASANWRRLWATACASSCTWSPRFMWAYGGCEMPPSRLVINAPTQGGAGHCGTSHVLGKEQNAAGWGEEGATIALL